MALVASSARSATTTGSHGAGARWFYVALVGLMIGIVLVGFWPYYSALASGGPDAHWVIHLHGAVFSGWMLLLLVQVMLVWRGRVRAHQRLGQAGLYYGLLVLLLGLVAAIVAPVVSVQAGRTPLDEAAAFLIVPLGDMLLFAGFFGAGMVHRRQKELHKRLMLMATMVLLFAPVGRMLADISVIAAFVLWLTPLVLGMAYDRVVRGRVERVYVVGMAVMVVAFSRVALMESEAWRAVGRAMLLAFMPAGAVPG